MISRQRCEAVWPRRWRSSSGKSRRPHWAPSGMRGRRAAGYRNGSLTRRVVTGMGAVELRVPRARLRTEESGSKEWRSSMLPRYQRRSTEVDEAILGCYLAGANSRRIRKALSPLLGEECLSKSAVSRVVQRLVCHHVHRRQPDAGCRCHGQPRHGPGPQREDQPACRTAW